MDIVTDIQINGLFNFLDFFMFFGLKHKDKKKEYQES